MNRTTLGLLVAAIVAVGALMFLRKQDQTDEVDNYPQRRFAVEQVQDIQQIFIADLQGRRMKLARGPQNAWLINDSLEASPSIMQEVISALNTIQIDHLPPKTAVPKILEAINTSGLKVTALGTNDEVLTSFILGPTTYDDRNSYAVVDGYSEPFAVRILGLSGTLRPLFDLRSVDAWRSKTFIAHDPATITGVELGYPRQPGESFKITKTGERPQLEALSALTANRKATANVAALSDYLGEFERIALSRREIDPAFRDSVRQQVPFAFLRVATGTTDTTEYAIWPWYVRDQFGEVDLDQPVSSYLVYRNGSEFVTVQEHQLREVLRSYSSFLQ